MKLLKQLLFFVLAIGISTSASAAMVANAVQPNAETATMSQAEFLALTPKAVKEKTGKKMKLKERIALKMAQKKMEKAMKNPNAPTDDTDKILIYILCILLPPLAVYLIFDEINTTFWINVILTLLGGLPGIIHALIVATNNL